MLTNERRERYDRHLRLEGFGEVAQERLLAGSVLVVGAGGLGSPALLYLAAAGVGRIGIVDDDVVERSNLQRQVVHRDADVGVAKVASAARAVREANPDVDVRAHETRLDAGNARALIGAYDVVLDGTDDVAARYLIGDAGWLEGVPVVHGAVHGFEGRVTVFARDEGPCYRCLFPVPPPAGALPSCAGAGVLGVLPGAIGTVQATEAIKRLAVVGESLVGRLLRYDALTGRWSELRLPRDPACPLCGDRRSIRDVVAPAPSPACDAPELVRLRPGDLERLRGEGREHLLVDVREPHEVAAGALPGARCIPLGELRERMGELDDWRDRLVVCACRRGGRGIEAARLLRRAGFSRVAHLEGGSLAWRARGG